MKTINNVYVERVFSKLVDNFNALNEAIKKKENGKAFDALLALQNSSIIFKDAILRLYSETYNDKGKTIEILERGIEVSR